MGVNHVCMQHQRHHAPSPSRLLFTPPSASHPSFLSSQAVTIDVADLEEDASPEDLMLSYVSADKGKDRTEREQVTPWFRFLWEAYRTVLEILRINPKLESLYQIVAIKAFHFCLEYKRNTEFRRLCDILRQHLQNQLRCE